MNIRAELTPDVLGDFYTKYGHLHDAVIHEMNIEAFGQKAEDKKNITLIVGVITQSDPIKWNNMILIFEDVSYFDIFCNRYPAMFGIVVYCSINFFENQICFDFYPYVGEHTGYNDLFNPREKGDLALTIVSKHCYWHLEPYRDRHGTGSD